MTTYFQLYRAINQPADPRTLSSPLTAANRAPGSDPATRLITPKSSLLLNPSLHDARPRPRPRPLSEQLRNELLETANDNFPPMSPFFRRMG